MIFNLYREKRLKDRSDKELLRLFQSDRDTRLAGELFSRYAPLVYGNCLKFIKDKEEARDITMNIFEKMLTHLESTEVLAFKGWLMSITKNTCLNHLRNKEKMHAEMEDWKKNEKKSENFMENEGFSGLINKGSYKQRLESAIGQLKPEQKLCMELFFYDSLSYKEIEEKTGYTLKQIKSFLQNGKRKVKLIIESDRFADTHE